MRRRPWLRACNTLRKSGRSQKRRKALFGGLHENPLVRAVRAGADHDSHDHASDVCRYGARDDPDAADAARLARALAASRERHFNR
jgi:hypothetical protein